MVEVTVVMMQQPLKACSNISQPLGHLQELLDSHHSLGFVLCTSAHTHIQTHTHAHTHTLSRAVGAAICALTSPLQMSPKLKSWMS